jgi:hypothetical protein
VLPIFTTPDDVREIVRYLRTKPTGASMAEAKAAVKKVLLDPRKLNGYEAWGFISRSGDRLILTQRGWDLSRKPDREIELFRDAISEHTPYRSVLEWAHFQAFDALSNVEAAAHWHEHHRVELGNAVDNTIKDAAVCFFHLCTASNLGTLTFGRNQSPTRLVLNHAEIKAYVEAGPVTPPWEPATDPDPAIKMESTVDAEIDPREGVKEPGREQGNRGGEALRVFIAHGKNMEIVEQVQTMLQLADIESEVAEAEESTAIPVPEKVLNAMRRCRAGIITVTVDEGKKDSSGNYTVNENVLIEIGAAFVLYDRRVVLLWDKRIAIPSNLQGLYRCEFEGEELSWSAGMKLMKAIQGFKR